MMTSWNVIAVGIIGLVLSAGAEIQNSSPEAISPATVKLSFWQTNHLTGGQGGTCAVRLGFDGSLLQSPIDGLTLSIRVLTPDGVDLGLSTFSLESPLGGSQ